MFLVKQNMEAAEQMSELIRGMASDNPALRTRCAKQLGKITPPPREGFSYLVSAVDDPDQPVREAAVHSLGSYGALAVGTLVSLLMHPDKYVRRNAVWALGKMGPVAKPALVSLCHAMRDDDPRTASGAAQALGNMGEAAAAAVTALAEAMRGTNVVLCRLAAKALSQVGIPAISTLISHLKHHDPFVRGEAAIAIGWIGPAAEEAVPDLLELIFAPFSHHTPQPGLPQMGGSGVAGGYLSGAVTPLAMPQATSVDSATLDIARSYAVQALGRIGPGASAALPAILQAIDDPSEQVRQMAEVALRQIRSEV